MQEIARRLQAFELALERGRLELELYAPERAIDHEISISDDEIIAYISKKSN